MTTVANPVHWFDGLASNPTHDGWETIAAIATGSAAFIAFIALIGVWLQIQAAREINRESLAHQIWREYLQLAFTEPEFAAPNIELLRTQGKFEKYEWFISVMLHGAEQILLSGGLRRDWKRVVTDQIRYHFDYVSTRRFRRLYYPHYSIEVQRAIDAAILEGPFDDT